MVLRQGGDLAQVETFYSPQKGPGNCTRPLPSASKAETGRAAVLSVFLVNLAARPLRQLLTVTVGGGIAALSVSYDSCKRPEEPRRYRRVPRCIARRRAWVVSGGGGGRFNQSQRRRGGEEEGLFKEGGCTTPYSKVNNHARCTHAARVLFIGTVPVTA